MSIEFTPKICEGTDVRKNVEGKLIDSEDNLGMFGKVGQKPSDDDKMEFGYIDKEIPGETTEFGKTGTNPLAFLGTMDNYALAELKSRKTEIINGRTYTDVTDKFSQEEIIKTLKRAGANVTFRLFSKEPDKYRISLCDDRVVINNESMTNDTTVIQKDGTVLSTGSLHCREIAPKGSHPDVFKYVQDKVKNS